MIELDVHTHLAPINAARLTLLEGVTWDAATETLTLDGHRIGIRDLFHADRLIARMDRHQVQRALVSVPPPLYRQGLAPDGALAWARYLNEELREIAAYSDGRLGALFYVPLEHPSIFEALLAEFDASAYEGIALAAGGHPHIQYSRPDYEALWQWLDAKSLFVFMHPGSCADTRLSKFYLENLLGNPIETGVAAAHLVMAGIPERFAKIRFCLAHAGGIFTSLVGRMERGFETARPGMDLKLERPILAARRFYVDSIAHHPGVLALAEDVVGKDHVLYGSDWPFPMGLPDDAALRP